MSGLILRTGNLWLAPRSEHEPMVVTTNGFVKRNGECVMGRGIARQVRDGVPGSALKLGELIARHGNRPFRLYPDIWTMPVKHNWMEQADLDLMAESLVDLAKMAERWQPELIRFPRPGCGNGGLDWERDGVHAMMDTFAAAVDCTIEVWNWS